MKKRVLLLLLLASPCLASTTRHVGVGQTYATLRDALTDVNIADTGDSIIVHPGTYLNDHGALTASNVTIKGLDPRPVFDAGLDSTHIENQQAILIVSASASNITIDNLEFAGAVSSDGNGCGVRIEPENSPGWVAIRNCDFHDNQNHIVGCPDSLLVERCELGQTIATNEGNQHCIYVNQNACRVFVFRYNYAHQPHNGHEVKSRAQTTQILYNRLSDDDTDAIYNIDIPDCGTAYIIGNVIVQGVNTSNNSVIRYGAETGGVPGRDFYVINNTIVNRFDTGVFINTDGAPGGTTGLVVNNIFYGPGTLYSEPGRITSSNNYVDGSLDNGPGFFDPFTDDYHLTTNSPVGDLVGAGIDPGLSLEGFALLPTRQYVYDASSEARPTVGLLDIGAFELSAGGTAISALLVSVDADASGARLEWYAPGDDIVSTAVYRRSDGTDWVLLGHPEADVSHRIAYEDRTVVPGTRYDYRLVVRDVTGAESFVDTSVEIPGEGAPRVATLKAAWPNPFAKQVALQYGLPAATRVRLSIHDLQGRRVATVIDGVQPAGWSSAVWDGHDAGGRPVASGMYFARLEAGRAVQMRKIIVAR